MNSKKGLDLLKRAWSIGAFGKIPTLLLRPLQYSFKIYTEVSVMESFLDAVPTSTVATKNCPVVSFVSLFRLFAIAAQPSAAAVVSDSRSRKETPPWTPPPSLPLLFSSATRGSRLPFFGLQGSQGPTLQG